MTIKILPLVSEAINTKHNDTNNITGGVDYDSGPYTVSFPAGAIRASFNITIDDNVLETTENFSLTIATSSLPTGITRGNPSSATVIILDNDRK